MKVKKSIAFLLFSCMIFITACSSKSVSSSNETSKKIKDGGNIVFAIGSDPQALNPLYASDRVTMTINNALYAPLFVLNGDKNEYVLAESLKASSDFTTYTLKLKKDLKWHDGEKLTADDVIYTMSAILDEKQNSFLRELFIFEGKPIEVKKVDEVTVEFKLPTLTMAFVASLAQVSPLPKHVFEKESDLAKSSKNDSPIGSGPFKFKEFKKGESITLVKFDDYIGGKPHLDSVVYRVIADPNASNVALQNGEISAKYIEPKDADKYKKDANFAVETYNEGMMNGMVFNLNNEVIKNKELRQAIAYGINKDELIKGAYISTQYAEPAYSVFTPDTLYYTKEVNHFDFSVDKAKETLNKSGAKGLKLKLGYINSKGQEAQALVIQQNAKNIGVEIELLPMERGAFYKKLLDPKNKDFDLAFNGYVMGSEPDSYKGLFMEGEMYNVAHYVNKDLDVSWNKGVIEKDAGKRAAIYKTIQKNIIEDMTTYPIAYPKSIVAISKKYGGVKEAKTVPIFMFQDLSKLYVTQ